MLYSAEVWVSPRQRRELRDVDARHAKDRAPTGITAWMQTAFRKGLVAAAGALRGTASNVLEVHLDVMPLDLQLKVLRHRATLRIAALPPTHALHRQAQDAFAHKRKTHKSALHALFC
jgi:hypothetical protein